MSGSLPSSCCEGDGPSSEIFVLKIRLHTSKRHVSKDAMVRTTTTTAAGTAVQVLAFEYLSIEYHRISCRIWVAGLNKIPKTTQTSLNISLYIQIYTFALTYSSTPAELRLQLHFAKFSIAQLLRSRGQLPHLPVRLLSPQGQQKQARRGAGA